MYVGITIEEICEKFGVDYGDLLAYAAHNHWVKPRPAGRHSDLFIYGSAADITNSGNGGAFTKTGTVTDYTPGP